MLIKTLLNKVYPLKSFVYTSAKLMNSISETNEFLYLLVHIEARKNSHPVCSGCGKFCPGYDRLEGRQYQFISLWGIQCFFHYKPRRVSCKICGIRIEAVPWSDSKSHLTIPLKIFLAQWAKKMSWKEVAESFMVSWESVFRSVKYAVSYGLENRSLEGITAIGIDEIKYKTGHNYLTLVYQIDEGVRRLLFIGKGRSAKTLLRFFVDFGKERTGNLKFICTDMWKAYLKVIRKKAPKSLNILDRFHIRKHLNEALDEVRKKEASSNPILKNSRWALMKNPENMTETQASKMKVLLDENLRSIRCYLRIREFEKFWKYKSVKWAEQFFDSWTTNALRSKIDPLKRKVKMLRRHKELLLNYFRAKNTYSSGVVEGLNNRVKVTIRKSYGFKQLDVLKIALYHQLGDLPEPSSTHKFC